MGTEAQRLDVEKLEAVAKAAHFERKLVQHNEFTKAARPVVVLELIDELKRHQSLYDHMKSMREAYGYESWTEVLTAAEYLKAETAEMKEQGRVITLSGCKFREDELIRRAVRNVSGSRRNTLPRWALVRDAFGCGSGVATALCRRFDFDPDEVLKG